MPNKNEFIIGLGGVGGRSIKAFRRTCKVRKEDFGQLEKQGMRFQYLYIDSNDDILNGGGWEVYGEDISLLPAEIVQLKEGGAIPPISQISTQANIAPWIGKLSEHFTKRTRGIAQNADTQLQGLKGAGQLRRFGRALFARHVTNVRNVVSSKIDALQNGRESDINFRIFCTLGGGTGSGSLIDMITMLRTMGKQRGFDARIFVYPFIAGAAAEASDAGSFYENEYASLRDLNALMTGRYHPYVVGQGAGANQGNDFTDDPTPVQQVFLSSEVAPGNPALPQQVDYMAKACFDAIVYTGGKMSEEANCLKSLSGEDLVDVSPGEPSNGTPLRSYRFSAFGARRWCVPTTQIKELLKHDTTKRIYECLLGGSPLPKGVQHRDASGVLQAAFKLENGSVFEALDRKMEELMMPLAEEMASIDKNNKRDPQVLTRIHAISDKTVAAARNLMGDAMELANMEAHIEEDAQALFKSIQVSLDKVITWKAALGNAWGVKDVQTFLGNYTRDIAQWPAKLLGGGIPDAERDDAIVGNMRAREEEWGKLGFLTIQLTQTDERMIEWQKADATQRVKDVFMSFRKHIIDELCTGVAAKITSLKNRVDAAVRDLTGEIQNVETQIGKYETELTNNAAGKFGDLFEYDAENLGKVRAAMAVQAKALQEAMAATYSPEWESRIGSLAVYTSNGMDTLCHSITSKLAYTTSEHIHGLACQQGAGAIQPVLVASIIDRLAQIAGPEEARWAERLRPRVQKFLASIGSSVTLTGKGSGLRNPQVSPVAAICFGFPSNGANAKLCDWLKQELMSNIPTDYAVMAGRSDTYNHNSDHEIRVLYVPYWFPARFAQVVNVVYGKYVQTSQSQEGPEKTYFSNIDDNDNGLNSHSRPALTTDGDPDRENETKIEIAKKFFVRQGNETTPILHEDGEGIKLLKELDSFGMPQYSQRYPLSMRTMPSPLFKRELAAAIEQAKKTMTQEDKAKVVQDHVDELKRLRDTGVNQASDEYEAANARYLQAKDILGM